MSPLQRIESAIATLRRAQTRLTPPAMGDANEVARDLVADARLELSHAFRDLARLEPVGAPFGAGPVTLPRTGAW